MYQQPYQIPNPLKVRYKTFMPVLYLVLGSILTLLGLLAILVDAFSIWVILGPLFIVSGVMLFSQPALSFDAAQGNLYMHNIFGGKIRKWGAIKGERLVFDGENIIRVLPDGKQKRVRTGNCRPEEVQWLQHAIVARDQSHLQQPPTA